MKNTKNCVGFCGSLISIVSGIICVIYLVSILEYNNINRHTCNITHVDYPTILPLNTNSTNWISCDCGSYCVSWAPCIRIYTDIKPTEMIYYDYSKDPLECTIPYVCDSDITIENLINKLNESINLAEKYENSTINCYYNDKIDDIYMNLSFDTSIYIICGIGF